MSSKGPEGFDFSYEEKENIYGGLDPSIGPYDPPKKTEKEITIYGLSSCLGIIGMNKDKEQLIGQHISNPDSSDLEKLLKNEEYSFIVLSGLNYREIDLKHHKSTKELRDQSIEEILNKPPKEVLRTYRDSNQETTYLSEFILKRGLAEKVCEDSGAETFPYWSQEPEHATMMRASIPEKEIDILHYKLH